MRIHRLAAPAAALAVVLTGALALAGGSEPLDCPNQCPLAQGANALRTNGSEGARTCEIVRHDVRAEVLASLDRV